MRFVDCHSVMWPNERYERRMTGRGSRNDAGFDVEKRMQYNGRLRRKRVVIVVV
jgi:hypothetical protein